MFRSLEVPVRRLALLLCAGFVLAALSACGGEEGDASSSTGGQEGTVAAGNGGSPSAAAAGPKELRPGYVRWEMGCPFPYRGQHPKGWSPVEPERPAEQQRSVRAGAGRTLYLRGYGTHGSSQLDLQKRTFVGGDDSVGAVTVAGEAITVYGGSTPDVSSAAGISSRSSYRLYPPALRIDGETVRWMALEAGLEGPGDAIVPHDTVMMILRSLEFVDC